MTDDELDELSEKIREQQSEVRDYLANEGIDVSAWDSNDSRSGTRDSCRDLHRLKQARRQLRMHPKRAAREVRKLKR